MKIKKPNLVDKTMEILGISTNKELSDLSGVSEKTISGWKNKISPLGEVLLRLLIENHKLKDEVEDFRKLKEILGK